MNEKRNGIYSQMFTLRVWMEEMGDGRGEVRGQIKHVHSGEIAYFREWAAMETFVKRWMRAEESVER